MFLFAREHVLLWWWNVWRTLWCKWQTSMGEGFLYFILTIRLRIPIQLFKSSTATPGQYSTCENAALPCSPPCSHIIMALGHQFGKKNTTSYFLLCGKQRWKCVWKCVWKRDICVLSVMSSSEKTIVKVTKPLCTLVKRRKWKRDARNDNWRANDSED